MKSLQRLVNALSYAFAFQALGVSYWNNREAGMDAVLEEFDELLDDFVYKKIWSSLTTREREIVRAINTDEVKASEICVRTGISNSSLSQYIQQNQQTEPSRVREK